MTIQGHPDDCGCLACDIATLDAARDLAAIERLYEELTDEERLKPAGVVLPQAIWRMREKVGR